MTTETKRTISLTDDSGDTLARITVVPGVRIEIDQTFALSMNIAELRDLMARIEKEYV